MEFTPEVGQVWEVLLRDNRKMEEIKQLRLIKKTEMTYTFADPNDNPYYPVLHHIRICNCILNKQIIEDFQTRIIGFPDQFYDNRVLSGPQKPKPNIFWKFYPERYVCADIKADSNFK